MDTGSLRILGRQMAYELSNEEVERISGGLSVNTLGEFGTTPSMCFVGMHNGYQALYEPDDCAPDASFT